MGWEERSYPEAADLHSMHPVLTLWVFDLHANGSLSKPGQKVNPTASQPLALHYLFALASTFCMSQSLKWIFVFSLGYM